MLYFMVHSFSLVWHFVTPWTAAGQASPSPRVCSKSCLLSRWCHPTISSSVVPFSSCLQSFPASGSFQMSQFFQSGGQRIGVSASASVLPMNIKDWSPLGWTSWISLQSKGLSRVFSNTTRRTGHGGEVWQNVVHWRTEWQTTSVFLPWERHGQYEKCFCRVH